MFGSAYALTGASDGVSFEGFSPLGASSSAGLVAGIMMPALVRARSQARTVVCKNNLRQIGLACSTYANEHGSMAPQRLEDLFGQQIRAKKILVCPEDKRPLRISEGLECSYRYVGQLSPKIGPGVIVAYDKRGNHRDGRNVLLFSGQVMWAPERLFAARLQQSLARVKKVEWAKHSAARQAEIEAFYSDAQGQ